MRLSIFDTDPELRRLVIVTLKAQHSARGEFCDTAAARRLSDLGRGKIDRHAIRRWRIKPENLALILSATVSVEQVRRMSDPDAPLHEVSTAAIRASFEVLESIARDMGAPYRVRQLAASDLGQLGMFGLQQGVIEEVRKLAADVGSSG